MKGKTARNTLGEKRNIKFHGIETEAAWRTFVEAIPYVKDELKKSRLEALATLCNSNGDTLKAAALDIYYHKECWKSFCRPVYDAKTNAKRTVQRRQREKWIQDKKQEAFKILCTHISERLETQRSLHIERHTSRI